MVATCNFGSVYNVSVHVSCFQLINSFTDIKMSLVQAYPIISNGSLHE